MGNNAELAFLNSAKQVGLSLQSGIDPATRHEITHFFYAPNEDPEFRKALEKLGFEVCERQDSPGFEAARLDFVSALQLKLLVEELCRTADKYAADYDGWTLSGDTKDGTPA